MTHLTDLEIVDFVDQRDQRDQRHQRDPREYREGTLAPERIAHLDTCETCQRRAQGAIDALARAAESDVPEPSPLFWEHFSERVRDGIRGAAPAGATGWRLWLDHAGLRWALSGALLLAVIAGAAWRLMMPQRHAPPQPAASYTSPAVPSSGDAPPDDVSVDADPAWAVVRTLADEVAWSDSVDVGLAAGPDAADRVADTLTTRERSELLRLIQAEIKQPGE